jgi:hypothetical protein
MKGRPELDARIEADLRAIDGGRRPRRRGDETDGQRRRELHALIISHEPVILNP